LVSPPKTGAGRAMGALALGLPFLGAVLPRFRDVSMERVAMVWAPLDHGAKIDARTTQSPENHGVSNSSISLVTTAVPVDRPALCAPRRSTVKIRPCGKRQIGDSWSPIENHPADPGSVGEEWVTSSCLEPEIQAVSPIAELGTSNETVYSQLCDNYTSLIGVS